MEQLVKEAQSTGPQAVEFLASDLFLKGADASIRGDALTAVLLFEYIHKLKPKDTYVHKKFAIELIRVGKIEDAQQHLEYLFKKSKHKDEGAGLILGGVYTALEQKKEARNTYLKILKTYPKNEEACLFLAKSYADDKKYQKADHILDDCHKKAHGKNAVFVYYKGKIAIERNELKSSKKYFEKALKIDPSFHQAALALGLLQEEKENYPAAIKIYENFIKDNPENFSILSRLVQLLFVSSKFKKVIPYAEKLISLDPTDLNIKVRLGIIYTDANRYNEAIAIFKQILQAVPNSDKVLYYLGSLHHKIDDQEKAIEYFSRIPSESPLFSDGHLQIAQILQFAAMDEGAENMQKERFVEFVSKSIKGHQNLRLPMNLLLSNYYENWKEYPKAISVLESVKAEQGYGEGHDYYLASLYEKNSEVSKARKLIRDLLDKNPKNAHALNFLGYSLLEAGENLDEARTYIERAVELRPEDGYIRDSLGWYFYKTGNLKRALEETKKAYNLVNDDVVISKHLAIIYRDMKRYQQAKKFYVEALKQCKEDQERNEVMKELQDLERIVRLPASGQK